MLDPIPSSQHRPIEFWSSVGPHGFQTALFAEIKAAGWPVAERSLVSMDAYRGARGALARFFLRARAYGAYPVAMRLHMARSDRHGIAVVSNSPFFAPTVAALANPRPVINWLLDIYPHALVVAGKVAPAGLAHRALHKTVAAGIRRAAVNVFLGSRLKRAAEEDFGEIPRAVVIPVGADGTPFRHKKPRPEALSHAPVRIIYCGNMGYMHDIDTVGAVLQEGLPPRVAMRFHGNGVGFNALAERSRSSTHKSDVAFAGNLEPAAWVEEMLGAQVALVTMRPGAEKVVMPSKTYSALMAGQAVLAICPKASDLADLVLSHDAGWVVVPGDVAGLRSVLGRIGRHPDEVLQKRINAWEAGHALYDQRVIARQWAAVFAGLEEQSFPGSSPIECGWGR